MKKTILILTLILFATSTYAANIDFSSLGNNPTQAEKDAFYQDKAKPVVMPILLNSLVGFGIGSLTVGDGMGLTTGIVLDSASFTAIIGGFGLLLTDMMIQNQTVGLGGVADPNSEVARIGKIMTYSGLGGLLLSRIVQGTMVGLFSSNYNKDLKNSLNAMPVVELVGNNGLYIGTKIQF